MPAELATYPPILRPKEAAQILRCTERHITNLCQKGELKAVKTGRYWKINRDHFLKFAGLI